MDNPQNQHLTRRRGQTGSQDERKQHGGGRGRTITKASEKKEKKEKDKNRFDDEDEVFSAGEEHPENEIPEILLCKTCEIEFNNEEDKLIECEKCEHWECQECTGMSDIEYQALTKPDSMMHWFCKLCNAEALSAVKTSEMIKVKCEQYAKKYVNELREELKEELTTHMEEKIGAKNEEIKKEFTKEFDAVRKTSKAINSEIKTLRGDVQKIKKDLEGGASGEIKTLRDVQKIKKDLEDGVSGEIDKKLAESASSSISEIKERESRKKNLVFFNIHESEETEAENRIKDDKREIETIFQAIEVDAEISNIFRIGKKGENSRPIKIKVRDEEDVDKILKAAKKLNGSDIYISKDMTPLERQEHRKLVQEKKRKKEESEEKGEKAKWIIRGGKVINTWRAERQTAQAAENTSAEQLPPRPTESRMAARLSPPHGDTVAEERLPPPVEEA